MSPAGVVTSKEIILQTDYFWLRGRAEGVRLTETFEEGVPQTPEITAIFSPSRGERSSMYTSTILVLKHAEFMKDEAEFYQIFVYEEMRPVTLPPPVYVLINGTMHMLPQPETKYQSFYTESKNRIGVSMFGPLVLVQLQQDNIEEDVEAKPSNISTDIYMVFKDVSERKVSRACYLVKVNQC